MDDWAFMFWLSYRDSTERPRLLAEEAASAIVTELHGVLLSSMQCIARVQVIVTKWKREYWASKLASILRKVNEQESSYDSYRCICNC